MAVEYLSPTLLWSASYPGTTALRVLLHPARVPFAFRGEGPVAPTPMCWAQYPDTTTRFALPVSEHPHLFTVETPEGFPPTLQWSATYQDTTRRAELQANQHPYAFRVDVVTRDIDQLAWRGIYPLWFPRPRLVEYPAFTSVYIFRDFNKTAICLVGEYRTSIGLVGQYRTTTTMTGSYRTVINTTGDFREC